MKKIIFTFFLLLLPLVCVIFFIIGTPVEFHYPAPEEFPGIFSEAGLSRWTVKDTGRELEGSAEMSYSRAWRYELGNRERRIRCQLLIYLSHAETPGVVISLLPADQVPLTEKECRQLLGDELPELWRLASKLCSDPQVVLDLQRQMEEAYEQVTAPEQYSDRLAYFSEWGAQCSGIYATARMVKQDRDSYPMWDQIKLVGEEEYNDGRALEKWALSEVEDLIQATPESFAVEEKREKTGEKYLVCGDLSQFEEAGDLQFRNMYSSNLPANMSFYQKAVLTDESGFLPVYLAPTALSREELSGERFHLIQAVQNKNHEI